MRTSVLTTMSFGIAAGLCLTAITPAQAQQWRGSGNSQVRDIHDMPARKLKPKIGTIDGLDFSTLGLFGDAEVFGQYSAPRPFIFPFPTFGRTGEEFKGLSFEDYLTRVANSYELSDYNDYLFRFQFLSADPEALSTGSLFRQRPLLEADYNRDLQNEINRIQAEYGDFNTLPGFLQEFLIFEFERFQESRNTYYESIALHQYDYFAGGGFFDLPEVPKPEPQPEPEPFEPFEPVLPTPLIPVTPGAGDGDTATGDTNDLATLATEIAADIDSQAIADALLEAVSQQPVSASQPGQQAAAVATVPEPATLALVTLGAAAGLLRPRRR